MFRLILLLNVDFEQCHIKPMPVLLYLVLVLVLVLEFLVLVLVLVLVTKYLLPLSVPAASLAVERVFSQGGVILRPHRGRMSNKLLSNLIYLKCNKTLMPY